MDVDVGAAEMGEAAEEAGEWPYPASSPAEVAVAVYAAVARVSSDCGFPS